jgi:hypothetical protein
MPSKIHCVERYIFTKTGFSYRVLTYRKGKRLNKTFNTLEEAIKARDEFLSLLSIEELSENQDKNHL